MKGLPVINDMTNLSKKSSVINNITDFEESPVINNTNILTTWVKDDQLSTICNKYNDNMYSQ